MNAEEPICADHGLSCGVNPCSADATSALTRMVGASGDCMVDVDRVVRRFVDRTSRPISRRMHRYVVQVLRELADEIEADAKEQLELSRNELLDGGVQTIDSGSEVDNGTRVPERTSLNDLKHSGVEVLARFGKLLRNLFQMSLAGHASSPVICDGVPDSNRRTAA